MAHIPNLHGFTLLRNGLKYDYPFRESIRGLRSLCSSVVVALGQSDDGTEGSLDGLDLVKIPTVWDEEKRRGGLILSEQTNIALSELRKRVPAGWGFYLQADEAITERDFSRIADDLLKAEAQGCDCISFRYLHFWQSYEEVAIGKRWYPQEIRCVRLDSPIESYGDAQSFRGWTTRYESEAVIYHYGHVREAAAYEKKKKDFHRWWHPDSEISSVIAKGEKVEKREETLQYLGPHPSFMKERIQAQGGLSAPLKRKIMVLGSKSDFPPHFLERVRAELEFTSNEVEIRKLEPENVVLMKPLSFFSNVISLGKYRSRVPLRMGSPQALDFSPELLAVFRFSEKNVRVE